MARRHQVAVLQAVDAAGGLKVNAKLSEGLIVAIHSCTESSTTSCVYSISRRSDLQRIATDTDGHLVPGLRALQSPLTIFIDGIDGSTSTSTSRTSRSTPA